MTREEAAEKINWLYYEADYGNNLPDDMETAVDMAIAALKQPEIIRCKDCDWWTKQEASLQGRCALAGQYPTGNWFCANARRREE